MTDSWDLDDGTPDTNRKDDPDAFVQKFLEGNEAFDRDRFYTRATNKKDHSTTVRIALPKSFTALVEPIIQSEENPLRLPSEVYRHALVYGLLHLAEGSERFKGKVHAEVSRLLGMEHRATMVARAQEMEAEAKSIVAQVDEAIRNTHVELVEGYVAYLDDERVAEFPRHLQGQVRKALEDGVRFLAWNTQQARGRGGWEG